MAIEQIPQDWLVCTECEFAGPPKSFPVDTEGKAECPNCGSFEVHI